MSVVEEIFLEVSPLKSLDKLQLLEKIEAIWADEAEARLDAYDKGLISTVSAKDVFAKYTEHM